VKRSIKLNIMKNSIKLSALLLLVSTGIFAATPAKPTDPSIRGMVTFSTLATRKGVEIKINKDVPGKARVAIYNYRNDMVWNDVLSQKKGLDKAYVL